MKTLRNIFYERPRPISKLRKWQEDCSDLWQKYINADLIGIRTPTGSGKTLIGLLILEQGLKNGKRGVYLTYTHQLMNRIGEEARRLDIPYIILGGAKNITGKEYEKRKNQIFEYNRCKYIIISNFNAFLTTRDFPDNIDYLVIDDIDLFYDTLRQYYSVKIKNSNLTKNIYDQIIDALSTRAYDVIEKIRNKTAKIDDTDIIFPQDYELIKQIINDNISTLNEDPNFYFPYKVSSKFIDFYYWYLNNEELSILPNIFPINELKTPESKINRFEKIKKIILLSATVGQKERFCIELGLIRNQIQLICEIDFDEKDIRMGERLIFPITELKLSETSPISSEFIDITFEYIRQLILSFNKILLLCWQIFEKRRILKFINDNIKDVKIFDFTGKNYEILEEFSKYPDSKKSILIIANRYFGLDFPSSACKVCLITRLPTYLGNYDIFIRKFLKDQGFYDELITRRIIQSIGRINRASSDNALYFFLDPRFSDAIVQATSFYPLLGKDTRDILDFSYKRASGGLFLESIDLGNKFLNNINSVMDELMSILAPIRKDKIPSESDPVLEITYLNEILGWKFLYENAYDKAIEKFEVLINSLNFKRRDPKYKIKIEWYNYIIYLIYYKRERLGERSKLMELNSYFEKVKNSEILTWLNKIELFHTEKIKIRDVQTEIVPSKAQELFKEYAQQPKLFLGDLIILEEIKESIDSIKESLSNLGEKQISSPLNNLAIVFENICKKVLNKREPDIYRRLDENNRLNIAEILKVLKGKYYLRKTVFNKLDSEPRNLRNIIVHIKKEIPEYAEVIKYCNELKDGMSLLLKEVYFSDLIRISKKIAKNFRVIDNFEFLNDQDIKSRILEMWSKEKLIFEPEILDIFNFSSYSGRVKVRSEGKNYEFDIYLDM